MSKAPASKSLGEMGPARRLELHLHAERVGERVREIDVEAGIGARRLVERRERPVVPGRADAQNATLQNFVEPRALRQRGERRGERRQDEEQSYDAQGGSPRSGFPPMSRDARSRARLRALDRLDGSVTIPASNSRVRLSQRPILILLPEYCGARKRSISAEDTKRRHDHLCFARGPKAARLARDQRRWAARLARRLGDDRPSGQRLWQRRPDRPGECRGDGVLRDLGLRADTQLERQFPRLPRPPLLPALAGLRAQPRGRRLYDRQVAAAFLLFLVSVRRHSRRHSL